jgi:hypothetical protein
MLETLTPAADRRAAKAVQRQIDQLAKAATPPGVRVEANDTGVVLTGKRLRRRIIDDPQLRNFGR